MKICNLGALANLKHLPIISRRAMHSATVNYSSQQVQFPMETNNGEHYWAEKPNKFYQEKRPNFQGATFAKQQDLPSLPVPELNSTLDKYLQTIRPFCNDVETFERQQLLCKDFLENMGPVLQNRLMEYSSDKRNWMSKFWDDQSYLQYNDPIIPYVSYFYSHKPLPNHLSKIDNDPLVKATAIISTVVKFIEAIKDESLPAETIKGTPFCMNSFSLMFNNSRLPGNPQDNQDTNIFYSIYENNFITVAHKGRFYKLMTHDGDKKPLSENEIWKQLYSVVFQGSQPGPKLGGVGSLTSLPRDQWREVYLDLVKDPISQDSLETIHKSSFMLCLDLDQSPVTLEEKSRNCWHGDGINRFYDKSLQFLVTGNGSSGFLAEHSKMDGTPTLFMNNFVCQQLKKLNANEFLEKVFTPSGKATFKPMELPFTITPQINKAIESAQFQFKETMNEHDLRVWHYNKFGKTFIKNHGMSPDAFIQQVIQLAVFKYLKRPLPTYEAASTRKYFKGRTETGRSVSTASSEFVSKWQNGNISDAEKVQALRRAAKEHSHYLKNAANGNGVDRHFFGLKNMINSNDNQVPPLFKDSLFNFSSTWLISTSQLSSEYFDGYGWSQVYDNGFGLAYMLNNDWLHINIVNKPAKSGLSVNKLHYYLSQAADEICEALEKENKLKAKL
ncbi:carnitine O-acetyltransferase CAT2 [Saccharomyces eubayanus]|uniref:carnitine O-acetyltransferase CAT2 n=1 Tax=Saccharomyces eubayanus TaxID=1080349 RepID=UPI0006C3EE6F|nr:CAT2-like protein [Saccharomyces eubayanus]KOG97309.1 CAT2-like protein [Saccharomyces eubayanus]